MTSNKSSTITIASTITISDDRSSENHDEPINTDDI